MAAPKKTTTKKKPKPAAEPMPGAFQLLGPSWQAIRINLITLIELIIIPVMLALLGSIVLERHSSGGFGLDGLAALSWLLFAPGITYTLLSSARGESLDFTHAVRRGLHFFWRYVGVMICSGLIILVGFLLLIVPGFFMLRRYYLAPYYLIDRNLGVFETLRVCAEESKRFSDAVWGVLGVQILFSVFDVVPFIGWIASVILSVMYYAAPALRYEQITKAAKS